MNLRFEEIFSDGGFLLVNFEVIVELRTGILNL